MSVAALIGEGGPQAEELRAAAQAVLDCGLDQRLFVNESEAIVNRFERALVHLIQQRYQDESKILDSLPDKAQIVSVVVDAARNRPPYRSKAIHTRKLLAEHSREWDRAWKASKLATSVLGPPPSASSSIGESVPQVGRGPRPPIPFCLELIALGAVATPILAAIQGCDCHAHLAMFLVGLLLILPWLGLQILWCRPASHHWLLARLLAGRYELGGQVHRLGPLWSPSRIYQSSAEEQDYGFASFGRWWRVPKAAVGARASVGRQDPESSGYPVTLECPSCSWTDAAASLEGTGALSGLPREARFDGSAILFGPARRGGAETEGGEIWTKAGCLRFDFLYKLTASLALLGLVGATTAAVLPPHLSCGFGGLVRPPLKAVFLLDGSGSISDQQWKSEKQAAKAIVSAFGEAYGERPGMLNLGLVQFSSQARVELPMTADPAAVASRLDGDAMSQLGGGTDFAKPLRLCAQALAGYTAAGSDTFDLCILVTDGADGSSFTDDQLKRLVANSTAVFGIFVGKDSKSQAKLEDITKCGRAEKPGGCNFFAAADDFAQLKQKATEVAQAIEEGIALDCPALAGLFLLLLLALPCLAWWIWALLSLRRPTQQSHTSTSSVAPSTEERRLRTVGFNEAREQPLLPRAAEMRGQ